MVTRFEIKGEEKIALLKQIKHSANIFQPNRLLPNKILFEYETEVQNKPAFPTGLLHNVQRIDKLWWIKNFKFLNRTTLS